MSSSSDKTGPTNANVETEIGTTENVDAVSYWVEALSRACAMCTVLKSTEEVELQRSPSFASDQGGVMTTASSAPPPLSEEGALGTGEDVRVQEVGDNVCT